jgi:uncharacterized RDD family membrane protein YckC
MAEWQSLGLFVRSKTRGVKAYMQPAPPVQQTLCSECGQAFVEDDMIRFSDVWVCAGCKPIVVQKIKEGVTVSADMDYAGFWLRFGAWFIDYIILGIVSMITNLPMIFMGVYSVDNPGLFITLQLISTLLNFVIPAAYETWFVGKYAATPGKMACKIKVVLADGGKVSFGRAVGRHFAKFISALILGIGYIMAGFDDQKRALHDRICDTRVIKSGEI